MRAVASFSPTIGRRLFIPPLHRCCLGAQDRLGFRNSDPRRTRPVHRSTVHLQPHNRHPVRAAERHHPHVVPAACRGREEPRRPRVFVVRKEPHRLLAREACGDRRLLGPTHRTCPTCRRSDRACRLASDHPWDLVCHLRRRPASARRQTFLRGVESKLRSCSWTCPTIRSCVCWWTSGSSNDRKKSSRHLSWWNRRRNRLRTQRPAQVRGSAARLD
jgi:hypothetical protein